MAAVQRPRAMSNAPTVGSWDDLIKRNRNRSSSMGPAARSENDGRRGQPQSNSDGYARSGTAGRSAPHITPGEQHGQRSSMAFASHVSSMSRNSSPLRSMSSSDSLPDLPSAVSSNTNKNQYSIENAAQQQAGKGPPKRPQMYARPRRLTSPTKLAEMTENRRSEPLQNFTSIMNDDGRVKTMSWGPMKVDQEFVSRASLPSPAAPYRPPGGSYHRRSEMVRTYMPMPKPGPNETFAKLPNEVLRIVLNHLRALHLHEQSNSCATCWARDCCSVALSNRRLLRVARAALYEEIELVGSDSATQRKKYRGVYSTRLVLLRRSIRADPKLAALVRTIKVPALPDDALLETEEYHDVVASVVMACPNLERLDGFYPSYNHSHSRLFHALSTRTKLKEMAWIVDFMPAVVDVSSQQARFSMHRSRKQASLSSPAIGSTSNLNDIYLPPQAANTFVRNHMEWSELTHLTIHCLPGAHLRTPNRLINVVLSYLPSLQSLYLSDVPATSFDDHCLLTLPKRLEKLTLANCPGITTNGLATFATHDAAQDLETLTLIHQNIDSLPAIVRIFSKLAKLTTFSIVQAAAPKPDDDFFCFMPYVASQSLKMLHWDIFESALPSERNALTGSCASRTDDLIARSITAGGFPQLRALRTPCDSSGRFQALCRPKERVDLPGDRFRTNVLGNLASTMDPTMRYSAALPTNGSRPSPFRAQSANKSVDLGTMMRDVPGDRSSLATRDSGKGFGFGSGPSSGLGMFASSLLPGLVREVGSDLHQARLAAQERLEAARRIPRIEVNVENEDGALVESSGMAAYMGDVTSNITYCLSPDVGATDERGGLVGIAELLGDGGEDLSARGDGASRSGAGFGTGCMSSAASAVGGSGSAGGNRSGANSPVGFEFSNGGKEKTKRGSKLVKENGIAGDAAVGSAGTAAGGRLPEGCTGRWNSYNHESTMVDKNGDEWWWHTERGRWSGHVRLS